MKIFIKPTLGLVSAHPSHYISAFFIDLVGYLLDNAVETKFRYFGFNPIFVIYCAKTQ